MSDVRKLQSTTYPFVPNMKLMVAAVNRGYVLDEKESYKRSLELEPRK
jgi:hypothetical protein